MSFFLDVHDVDGQGPKNLVPKALFCVAPPISAGLAGVERFLGTILMDSGIFHINQ